ncbi:pro-resilin [Biomphalaria pfeifferi]|uniref:Pro-resilin n=1 Tax=Biomphalaria pfeifferi TaxID=112525 RepID=A0AAD8C9R4_BIOPF|nr:pro-resilin [Biomphalaria pfeifferi]
MQQPEPQSNRTGASTTGSSAEEQSSKDMDGPSFYCAYLNFSPISKPPTNLNALQNPIKELYFKYRKSPTGSRSASLKLTQKGVFVSIYEEGAVKNEIFFEFSSVIFVEAVRFLTVKTSSEKKPKALFAPADESKAPLSDKHAFAVEKAFHFLVSSTHPPLVVCVVRRPAGVKALDCHVFALDTVENALHISAVISSTQMPMSPSGNSRGDLADGKAKAGFDRGVRGDVIRTEYGEYSVYRGSNAYEGPPQSQRFSTGGPPMGGPMGGQVGPPLGGPVGPPMGGQVMSPVKNTPMGPASGNMHGGIMLTQENFRDPTVMGQQQMMHETVPGYIYEQQNFRNRPDVIMHVNQRSGDGMENPPYDRGYPSHAGSDQAVRMRMDDVQMRGGQRISGGQIPANNRISSGVYVGGPQFSPRNSDAPTSPPVTSPRSSLAFPPTSPRIHDSGPVFSASNLESRVVEDDPRDPNMAKPVAKVPPHMKGIKVLPTDFRAVKLKAKADKPADYLEDSGGYDNNKDLMDKYREAKENQRDSIYNPALGKSGSGMGSNYGDDDGFMNFSNRGRIQEDSRDFTTNWQETVREKPPGGLMVDDPAYRRSSPVHYHQYEDNNNKNRYSMPAAYGDQMGRQWGPGPKSSHSSYQMDSQYPAGQDSMDQLARMKDLEIANMFSNYRQQQQGGVRPPGDMYRGRNEFEEGLGYLP